MRIGIDARFFGPRAKGLGRYAQKLIEELERLDDQNEYLIFLQREAFESWQPNSRRFKKILAPYRWYSVVEQLIFPLKIYRYGIDLMHFAHFNVPVLYFRSFIVTIHDLILQKFPTAKNTLPARLKYWFKNIAYRAIIRLAVARAEKIITVSQFVKEDIIKSFGVAEGKISVIYEGAPAAAVDRLPEAGNKSVLEKYKIKKPYLLYVGNAYPHKNLEGLVEAFRILRNSDQPDLRLVLVDGEDYFYRQFKKVNCDEKGVCFGGGVIFTGFVPDEELGVLYKNAGVYVFPSFCEGFGLPPLEAMAYGAPVAASRATCLPEVLGQAARYFDAVDSADMAARISEVLTDVSLRQKLIVLGFEQIKKYSWRRMAEETIRIYAEVDTKNDLDA